MPHKMKQSSVKAGTNKVVSASPRRSIVARATEAVANTRKAIGKVAGRPARKSAAKVAVQPAPATRRPPAAARTRVTASPASRADGAKKGVAESSQPPKKVATPKAVPSRVAAKTVAPAKGTAKQVATKQAAGKKATAARKVTAKKALAKKALAKKAPAKKAPAKKAPAKKIAATKVTVKKVPAPKKTVPRVATPRTAGVKRIVAATPQSAARPDRRAPARAGTEKAAARLAPTRPSPARPVPVRAPRKGYAEERFLTHQRNVLEKDRATYLEQANSLLEEAELLVAEMEPGDIQFDEESGEGGTVAVDRERDLTLSAQALEEVEEIDAALAKIASGKYGVCEGCGELIPKLRLEALPYAQLCMACKSGGLSRR